MAGAGGGSHTANSRANTRTVQNTGSASHHIETALKKITPLAVDKRTHVTRSERVEHLRLIIVDRLHKPNCERYRYRYRYTVP